MNKSEKTDLAIVIIGVLVGTIFGIPAVHLLMTILGFGPFR